MAATEKQMKGVATWGRSGTFINTLRHSVSARGGKVLVVCCVWEAKWHTDWPTCGSWAIGAVTNGFWNLRLSQQWGFRF